MSHGQPRDGKTLGELEIALAASTGTLAFGMERFYVPEAVPVCYLTEEDSERQIQQRLKAMLKGRNLTEPPKNFHLAVRRGIDLDDPEWQEWLIRETKHKGFRFVSIDPLRAFTAHADTTPSELKPVVRYFRNFMRQTGCDLRISHHDTKPQQGKRDERDLAQRASGGGIFSIADCPFSFRRLNSNTTLVTPNRFKFIEDPKPFKFTLHCVTTGGLKSIQLIGEECDVVGDARDLDRLQKMLDRVKDSPGKPMSHYIQDGFNKKEGLGYLWALVRQNRIRLEDEGRSKLCYPLEDLSDLNVTVEV
jgi:AAA domain